MDELITIAASAELEELKLNDLVGRKGKINKILYTKDGVSIRGAWIELQDAPYLEEQEWYIPIKSITR